MKAWVTKVLVKRSPARQPQGPADGSHQGGTGARLPHASGACATRRDGFVLVDGCIHHAVVQAQMQDAVSTAKSRAWVLSVPNIEALANRIDCCARVERGECLST
ncbi:hypothetical protein PybrP1_007803, partial [[Pythium] brassicae (nom. inval.)]